MRPLEGKPLHKKGFSSDILKPKREALRLAEANNPESILRYLQDITFPVKKDDLVHAARQSGAPTDIVATLSSLPFTEYANQQELIDAYPGLND